MQLFLASFSIARKKNKKKSAKRRRENAVKAMKKSRTQKKNSAWLLPCMHTQSEPRYSQYFYRLMRLLKRLLNSRLSIGTARDFFTLNDSTSSSPPFVSLLYFFSCVFFALDSFSSFVEFMCLHFALPREAVEDLLVR